MFPSTPPLRVLSAAQRELVKLPLDTHLFLDGPAGAGKTTAGVARLLRLLAGGVPGESVLLVAPQRTLAGPFYAALQDPYLAPGGLPAVVTIGGLAQRAIELFWPAVAAGAGFAYPDRMPAFLTLETAQYFMAHLVRPRLAEGYFEGVALDRNRLYSQVLDNLNKAALVGFPHTEIGARLKSAWVGEPARLRVYDDVQTCAGLFRQYCLAHNLLDFSLQLEVFFHYLWPLPLCRDYLRRTYRHLLVDNVEEDTPVAHDLLLEWLPDFQSALVIADTDAGYRSFLGADSVSAGRICEALPVHITFEETFVSSPAVQGLAVRLAAALPGGSGPAELPNPLVLAADWRGALCLETTRFYPAMLDWVAGQVTSLIHDWGVPPGEIVVLAPFLSDALRFALAHRLEAQGIPVRSQRPSRPLRDEPVTGCLLTLTMLAHPEWGMHPTTFDFAYALVQSIDGLDLVRAQLLSDPVFRRRDGLPALMPFEGLKPELQERITHTLGQRYEVLRGWLAENTGCGEELDYFLSRLFGEVLSQPGYGFHRDLSAGEVAANLIESIQKFRWAVGPALAEEGIALGQEYLAMVKDGVIAAQYIRSWLWAEEDAVLVSPAYTFLLSNRPVDVQFWLDAGSRGWSERLEQPLTHPYVLSRRWPTGRPWTDFDEVRAGDESLRRVVLGLLRRCRQRLYLGLSELDESGYEERGPLLRAFQRLLREEAP